MSKLLSLRCNHRQFHAFFFTMLFVCSLHPTLFSQTCASPVLINVCPVVFDDRNLGIAGEVVTDYNGSSGLINSLGNEVFYEVNITGQGANPIPVDIDIAVIRNSGPIRIIQIDGMLPGSCAGTMNYIKYEDVAAPPYDCPEVFSSYFFPIAGAGTYYFAIEGDGSSSTAYEVVFGGSTGTTTSTVTIPPSTGFPGCSKGVWQTDNNNTSCGFTPFVANYPFELRLNGSVVPTGPGDHLTFDLMGINNLLCIRTYFRNIGGGEGVKSVEFNFGPSLTATPVSSTLPAMNGGIDSWTSGPLLNVPSQVVDDYNSTAAPADMIDVNSGVSWLFWNGTNYKTRGDAAGCPTGDCLLYEFCFNIIATDNLPENTKVVGVFYPDGYSKSSIPPHPGGTVTQTLNHGCFVAPDVCYCPDQVDCFRNGMGVAIGGNGSANPTPPTFIVFDDPAHPASTPLPVDLISLEAESQDQAINISWITGSETNSNYFELQRSINGVDWVGVSKVAAAGHSTTTQYYRYLDDKLASGLYYYRLKQVDLDDSFEFSTVVSASIKNPALGIQLYPNPIGADLNLSVPAKHQQAGAYQIEVFDLLGTLLLRREVEVITGDNYFLVPTASVPKGVYILKVSSGLAGVEETLRFIKQ